MKNVQVTLTTQYLRGVRTQKTWKLGRKDAAILALGLLSDEWGEMTLSGLEGSIMNEHAIVEVIERRGVRITIRIESD